MDVRFFLKKRTVFIRNLYNVASAPYLEIKRKIEDEEDPFVPPYSEDGEPPFLEEWMEADESMHAIAYSCISMLAASLHLYLKEWENQFRIPFGESFKSEFKQGWLNGYKAYFAHHFEIRFEEGPVDFAVLEEVVLARNRIQHPQSITYHQTHYSNSDLKKLPHPFFIDENERNLLAGEGESVRLSFMPLTLHITGEKLTAAIEEVEKFVDWLEEEIDEKV